MRLPHLQNPQRYLGLYLFNFGEHVAVGYTAEEIEMLLASPEHRGGSAYVIHHVGADGEMALRGLSRLDTRVEEAMVFYRSDPQRAREDYEQLQRQAMLKAPPCPVHWHLARNPEWDVSDCTVLLYPAVCSPLVARWLLDLGYEGGDFVEGGVDAARRYRAIARDPLARVAIAPDPRLHTRPPARVLAAVHEPVQREL